MRLPPGDGVREPSACISGVVAGGPGFEPGPSGPEPEVLPLNYPPAGKPVGARSGGSSAGADDGPGGRLLRDHFAIPVSEPERDI